MNKEIKNILQDLRCVGIKKDDMMYIYNHEPRELLFAICANGYGYFKNAQESDLSCYYDGKWFVTTERVLNIAELIDSRKEFNKILRTLELKATGGVEYDEFILSSVENDIKNQRKRLAR